MFSNKELNLSILISVVFHIGMFFLIYHLRFSPPNFKLIEVSLVNFVPEKGVFVPSEMVYSHKVEVSKEPSLLTVEGSVPFELKKEAVSPAIQDVMPSVRLFPVLNEKEEKISFSPALEERKVTKISKKEKALYIIQGPISFRGRVKEYYPKEEYNELLEKEKKSISGEVKMSFTVSPEGIVSNVDVIKTSGYPSLDSIAKDALMLWIFEPLSKSQPQIPQEGTITFWFKLR